MFPIIIQKNKPIIHAFIQQQLKQPNKGIFKQGCASFDEQDYIGFTKQCGDQIIKHGIGVYQYQNGDVYMGQWRDNQLNGQGKYLFINGQIFTGKFENGVAVNGLYEFQDGSRYEGQYSNSKKNGVGKMYYKDKLNSIYEGQWKDNKKEGIGKFHNSQICYEGAWKDGKPFGKGIIKFENALFEGQVNNSILVEGYLQKAYSPTESFKCRIANGKRSGQGQYIFDAKTKYYGQFINDNIEGKGIMNLQNGKYQGSFKNNQRDGMGTYSYNNGDKYIGQWHLDQKNGDGKQYYSNGHFYQGKFKNNLRDGFGIYKYCDSKKQIYAEYQGNFVAGKMQGHGKFKNIQQNLYYEGGFLNNVMHGTGTINGKKCLFQNGNLVEIE